MQEAIQSVSIKRLCTYNPVFMYVTVSTGSSYELDQKVEGKLDLILQFPHSSKYLPPDISSEYCIMLTQFIGFIYT
jgi:hypothetical protein